MSNFFEVKNVDFSVGGKTKVKDVSFSIKNEGDIIVGNAVGSSIFNVLAILGITALFKPLSVNDINLIDYSIMIGAVILCWVFVYRKMDLNRIKGLVFLGLYAAYISSILFR